MVARKRGLEGRCCLKIQVWILRMNLKRHSDRATTAFYQCVCKIITHLYDLQSSIPLQRFLTWSVRISRSCRRNTPKVWRWMPSTKRTRRSTVRQSDTPNTGSRNSKICSQNVLMSSVYDRRRRVGSCSPREKIKTGPEEVCLVSVHFYRIEVACWS